ncbi:MAG: tetratricopeptide repeat protein [Deltaproteobacteria bacterium]|nr:tetratricopeptide repeat protein [Deltaproteobacteria bacterium]
MNVPRTSYLLPILAALFFLLASCGGEKAEAPSPPSAPPAAAAHPVPAGPPLEMARQYLAQGRLDLAEAQVRRQLQADPKDPAAQQMLSLIQAAQGNYQRALDTMERAQIELPPQNPAAYGRQAELLVRRGQAAEAANVLGQGVQRFPDDASLAAALARLLAQEKGDPTRATALAARAVKLSPGNPDYWELLATLQAQEKHPAQAVVSFHQALRLRPGSQAAEKGLVDNFLKLDQSQVSRLAAPGGKP